MSATIEASIFTEYFNKCPYLEIPGRLFDVETRYLEDILKMVNFSNPKVLALNEAYKCKSKQQEEPKDAELQAKMNSLAAEKLLKNLDDDTKALLNETLEQMCVCSDPADAFNQFFYLVEGENIPIDCRHSDTNMTALMIAAGKGMLRYVNMLLAAGADPLQSIHCNNQEFNVHDLALKYEQHEAAEMIVEHMQSLPFKDTISLSDSKMYDKQLLDIYYDSCIGCNSRGQGFYMDDAIDLNVLYSLVYTIHFKFEKQGAILVFLPGYEDIIELNSLIVAGLAKVNDYKIYMLHSNMQTQDQ